MFSNRTEAGQALATAIEDLIGEDPSLATPVALARGGVPVAFEIASRLNAPHSRHCGGNGPPP